MRDQANAKAWRKAYQQRNRKRLVAKARQWKRDNPQRALFLWKRSDARRRGTDFTIEMIDLDWPKDCPVHGVRLLYGPDHGVNNPDQATIDRIDNSLGYISGNVAIMSRRANILKRDATLAELQRLVKWLQKVQRPSLKGE